MNGPTFATQTAPAPRVTRTAPPAVAPPRPPAKPDADNPALRLLTYLKLHWLTILFLGTLLGGAAAYAAYLLLPPQYESYALFKITSSPTGIATASDPTRGRTEFETYRKSSASQLKYEFVYTAALRDGRLTDLPTLKDERDPYKFLDEQVMVETKEGNEIIKVSMKGEKADDLQKIVDAIKLAYVKEVVQKDKLRRSKEVDDLKEAKGKLDKMMRNKAGWIAQPGVAPAGVPEKANPDLPLVPALPMVAEKQPIAPLEKPLPGVLAPPVSDESNPVKQAKFSKLVDRLSTLELDTIPKLQLLVQSRQNDIPLIKAEIEKQLALPDAPETEKAAKLDPEYVAAEKKVKLRKQEYENELSLVSDPTSKSVREMAKLVETAEIAAQKVYDEKRKEIESFRRKPTLDALNGELVKAKRDVDAYSKQLALYVEQLKKTQAELKDMPPAAVPMSARETSRDKVYDPNVTDLSTTDKLYELVSTRLTAAELDLQAPDRIQVLQDASIPQVKDGKKQLFGVLLGGLIGFVAVGGVCLLYELSVRRISTLGELKSLATTPVVGVLPWQPDGSTARDPLKRAEANEAIDKLRAYVAQTWLSRGATTVTVTSAIGDEGKAFTAFGLASSLAQAGYRTLLVDFDLRQPALHPFAGVTNDAGVCELLRGESDLRRTIQHLPNGLHFLAAGKWSDEARQAAVGGRLEALLTRLKEPFDCVVLHGHALLTVAETVEVARRSEVVLLCALYRESRAALLKKATERVATMEIPFSGVVYLGATASEALC